jgi:signal transduction histidine kinase
MQLIEEGIGRTVSNLIAKHQFPKISFSLPIVSLSIRQWLVLFGMGAVVIAIEVRSHTNMWLEHHSGQTLWTDPELIWEIILFGLVIPILGGIFLGYIGYTIKERDRIAGELELRRNLVSQISQAQNWDDLVELIVQTPGMLGIADRAWLLAQPSKGNEFIQIAYWERPDGGSVLTSVPIYPAICQYCVEAKLLKGTRLLKCGGPDFDGNTSPYNRYCLQLASASARNSVLLFDSPLDRPMTTSQMKMLNGLGGEISLAIDNANFQLNEQYQVDAARSERLRIARDLHDTLGQNVSYLRLQLELLNTSKLASDGAEFQEVLANMAMVADEAYEQVRDTLDELRTTEHRGLEEDVQSFASQASSRAGFSTAVHSTGQPATLSHRQSRQILYILREILNNVEKHADSRHVAIHLQWCDEEFRLVARDDGKGFNLDKPRIGNAYGLAIMKERSRAINADLIINSIPGSGTEITLILPLLLNSSTVLKSQ